jgi:hypothetical protein
VFVRGRGVGSVVVVIIDSVRRGVLSSSLQLVDVVMGALLAVVDGEAVSVCIVSQSKLPLILVLRLPTRRHLVLLLCFETVFVSGNCVV